MLPALTWQDFTYSRTLGEARQPGPRMVSRWWTVPRPTPRLLLTTPWAREMRSCTFISSGFQPRNEIKAPNF